MTLTCGQSRVAESQRIQKEDAAAAKVPSEAAALPAYQQSSAAHRIPVEKGGNRGYEKGKNPGNTEMGRASEPVQ